MRRNNSLSHMLLGAALILGASQAMALKELDDSSLSEVQGAGLAIAAHDFSFQAAPTSYIWVTGRPTSAAGWERGDLFYYGTSWSGGQSGAGNGTTFQYDGACDQGDPLSCPIGTQGIESFASVLNPYVFRVFEYPGFDSQGTYRQGNNMPSVMELIGPSRTDPWRWAFWGEIEVGRTGPGVNQNSGLLQSQTIIHGSPTTLDGRPAVIRYMRTQQGDFADPSQDGSFGIIYESALSGDFRFSVGQNSDSPDQKGWVPAFNDTEGMYFRNVDAFIPIGRMHYQTLQIKAPDASGNFQLVLEPIPDNANVYNEFYCGNITGAACTTQIESTDPFGNSVVAISEPVAGTPEHDRWKDTQGYVRWGDFTDVGNFALDSTGNGIMFLDRNGSAGAPNPDRNNAPMGHMGVSRIEGLRIQSMTLTTLGAGS